jgi:formylglycine-generating enzyme required for sulfatase activity
LPTAAEWEFAARSTPAASTGPEQMAGGVAEIVADCWSASRPMTLLGTGAGHVQRGACGYRVVKDAADAEPAQWRRVSARRAIPADAASPLVGFRIMRDFDLTAAKGF